MAEQFLTLPARKMNERGQCCGRKPLVYKRPSLYHFCTRCDAKYNERGEQIQNHAWIANADGTFTSAYPDDPRFDYIAAAKRAQSHAG